jgi:hypothetical protein
VNLSGIKRRVADLVAQRRALAATPQVVAFMPRNGREPADTPAGQFTTRPAPFCSVIHYDPENPPVELMTEPADDPFHHFT